MADVSFTAANVRALPSHGAIVFPGTAGGAITVGHLVYMASDGDWERADANVSEGIAEARAQGIAVESYDGEDAIAAGDPVSVCVFGPVGGFDITPGANYYVSDTVGRVSDDADAYDRIIGYGTTLAGIDVLFVHPQQNDPSSA